MPSQQTMTAWMLALQAQTVQAPGMSRPLIQAALAAPLELPTEHATIILEGLAGIASNAGKLLQAHKAFRTCVAFSRLSVSDRSVAHEFGHRDTHADYYVCFWS